MRILLVNHTGLMGGAEITTLNLLRSLPADVEAVLACPPGPLVAEAEAAGMTVAPVAGTSGSLRLHPRETARAIAELLRFGHDIRALTRRMQVDLVHATTIRAGLAAALPPGLRRPLVVSLHDCLPSSRLTAAIRRIVDGGATAIVANSLHTAGRWRDGRPGPRLEVIYPSFDADRFRAEVQPAGVRAVLGLSADAPVLGVAAQITPWKGHDTAIKALARLRETVPDAQLVLIGETKFVAAATRNDNRAYLESLRELVRSLDLERAVHFIGQCDDMPAILAALDVLLVPSWEEPFGLVTVEAMAVGTPVVATDVGGPREVIEDGESGRLVAPRRPELWADAVARLLADRPERERMAGAGLRRASGFRREAQGAAHANLYREVLGVADR